MRLAGLRSLQIVCIAVALTGAVAGCDNPFDPLKSSDKIQGLTYFDFAATQEHWDSDPEWDGLQIAMNYYNEFGDTLSFHDKPHQVQVEIWSETTSSSTPPVVTRKFLASKTVDFSNSDDFIRIPVEYYGGFLSIADPPVDISGCLQVRIFPPQEYPQRELVAPIQCDVNLYTAEVAPL
ncbi:MAG: hypothetical protein ACYC9Y_11145 [Candidatus Methylomirabilia bacterium]